MKLWLISQSANNGYDTYDSAVVAAESEDAARMTHPSNQEGWDGKRERYGTWSSADQVKVEFIGEAKPDTKPGVICASFNAG